jgi:hypothetical protein
MFFINAKHSLKTSNYIKVHYYERKTKNSGHDPPPTPEHTKGDDIWTFYRSVQTEFTSIEKVILIKSKLTLGN